MPQSHVRLGLGATTIKTDRCKHLLARRIHPRRGWGRLLNDEGGLLPYIARLPLESGGCVLVEAPATASGPVKAGRVGDAIHDLPGSLQGALGPVTEAARATLQELRRAGPDEVTVEFGVDLAVEAGAVITKTGANCHLKVTMMWKRDEPSHPSPDGSSG
ncbi:CU044_2847 family protein [Streptomyces sp. NPDC054783]